MTRRRVVLIGATGAFGTNLAAMLAKRGDIDLVVAARRREPLEELCRTLRANGASAHLGTAAFDRHEPHRLRDLQAWLVIDASGPFQNNDYALANAAITAGAHYIDLADARDFVAGFPAALDATAREHDVLAATGASSTPALSHAALSTLVAGWQRIDDVVIAISPGARAPIGVSVVQAILSYTGHPVRLFRHGQWEEATGWSGARQLDMPGLGPRWVSLCETPDLDLLPARFPVQRSATFLAGLELGILHLGLSCLAMPVRWGWIKTLRPLAAPLRGIARNLQVFGSDRGEMVVHAIGSDSTGRPVSSCWALVAAANAGPNVPVAAAAALVCALLDGRITVTGAQPAVGLSTIDDMLSPLAHLPITTRTICGWPRDPALFRRLLGPQFDELPMALQIVHGGIANATFGGRAVARGAGGLIGWMGSCFIGLPKQGHHLVAVTIEPKQGGETWTRRFGDSTFRSRLSNMPMPGIFEESFGPIHFVFDISADANGMSWQFQQWRLFGWRLPLWAAPQIRASTKQSKGRYRFSIVVAHRWIGLLFAYRGTLDIPHPTPSRSARG